MLRVSIDVKYKKWDTYRWFFIADYADSTDFIFNHFNLCNL